MTSSVTLTRRMLWLGALTAVLASPRPALAACGGRVADGSTVYRAPVCVPLTPRRIVSLDSTYNLTMALELGLPVAGAPLFNLRDPDLLAMAADAGVVDIGTAAEPSVERIIGLQPDLILGDAVAHAAAYDLASQIAPTVLVQAQDWKAFYATVARVTGSAGKADVAFAAYDAKAAAIRARLPAIRVSVLRVTSFGFQVYVDGPAAYAPFAVLADAGVQRTAYETTGDTTILKRPDWEGLSRLTGDVLLYMFGNPYDDESGTSLEADTLANPLWKTIPAVVSGRFHKVDVATWMGFGGLGSANKILDDVERLVLAAS